MFKVQWAVKYKFILIKYDGKLLNNDIALNKLV